MGGRGASSGVSVKGKPYGSEYKSVFQSGNIKFVVAKEGANTSPLETMTQGRIYVTVNKETGTLKSITLYDKENRRFRQIDLDHYHKINGKPVKPHTQKGYYHDGIADHLSPEDKKLVDRVEKIWHNRHGKS